MPSDRAGVSDPTLLRVRVEIDELRRSGAAFGVAEWASRDGGGPTAMVVIAANPAAAAALRRAVERELGAPVGGGADDG